MNLPDYIKNTEFVFDISSLEHDLRIKNPKMEEMPSWKKHKNSKDFNSKVLYILFMYDKKSPFIKKFPDLETRRKNAINESGIEESIVSEMTDKLFVSMISEFLRYQNDRLWALICMNESIFLQYSNILMQTTDDVRGDKDLVQTIKLKEDVRSNIMKVHTDLETLYNQFFGGDLVVKEKIIERFTPEMIARKIK